MSLSFAQPLALWGLLALPVIVAVHFLQQQARVLPVSTLFLIERLGPESRGGRRWERLRSSRALWGQLLAALLVVWVWAEPRWPRADSAQTVVLVLDATGSMAAFRAEAEAAARARMAEVAGRARFTEWVVLTTDPRGTPLYRGAARAEAEGAFARWAPTLGTHDPGSALRLARTLAGRTGLVWLITDRRERVPVGQPAVGVGRPLDNLGFVGMSLAPGEAGSLQVRGLVQNHGLGAARREWRLVAPGLQSAPRVLELAPGALAELAVALPPGVDEAALVLAGDEFTADDVLPLARPKVKRLTTHVDAALAPKEGATTTDSPGAFFQKVLGVIPGVEFAGATEARLRVWRTGTAPAAGQAGLRLAPDIGGEPRLNRAPVTAERHPWTEGLAWAGLVGDGPAGLAPTAADTVLLWQGDQPLAWTRTSTEGNVGDLTLNLRWEHSNAARLPAGVLLVRRYVEALRDAQPGLVVGNVDAGARLSFAPGDVSREEGAPEVTVTLRLAAGGAATRRALTMTELAAWRAPAAASWFELAQGERVFWRGAAQFADARQGDFAQAESFVTGAAPEAAAVARALTRADPLTWLWLALAAGALLWSWWPAGLKGVRA
jgi:hypothetical protein